MKEAFGRITTVVALVAGMAGCRGLDVERLRFNCTSSAECLEGFRCDGISRTCVSVVEGPRDAGGELDAGDAGADDDAAPRDTGSADATIPCPGSCATRCEEGACLEVVQLSASMHTCARMRDGTVWCWGQNGSGELGTSLFEPSRNRPARVPGLRNVAEVSVGANHTCARLESSDVLCWGANNLGQVGVPSAPAIVLAPTLVMTGAASIVAGPQTTCARTVTGTVSCWGVRHDGQNYREDQQYRLDRAPLAISGFSSAPSTMSLGGQASCASVNGSLECWGETPMVPIRAPRADPRRPMPTAIGPGVTSFALGYSHACAVRRGAVACWGQPWSLTLDTATFRSGIYTPIAIDLGSEAMAIRAGWAHCCALLSSGAVRCFGQNYSGQTGDGSMLGGGYHDPTQIALGSSEVVELVSGWAHNCVRLSTGEVRCWGDNRGGELGTGSTFDHSATPLAVRW